MKSQRSPVYTSAIPSWPDRILDDIGETFVLGAIGGSAFHFTKGYYNSPYGTRLVTGVQAVCMNAPRIGGIFAAWWGLFSVFETAIMHARQKDDPWNTIMGGVAGEGLRSIRKGFGRASRNALFAGMAMGAVEGVGIVSNKALYSKQPSYARSYLLVDRENKDVEDVEILENF